MFYEISAVAIVMVAGSVLITRRFTKNLNLMLKLQVDALAKVGEGSYDIRIPVATHDEVGIIAARTNEMIAGLRDRERIRATFGRYVSKEIRDVLLSKEARSVGETRDVTVLFCDLRAIPPQRGAKYRRAVTPIGKSPTL